MAVDWNIVGPKLLVAAKGMSDLYGHMWDTTEGGGFLTIESLARYDAAHCDLYDAIQEAEGENGTTD